MMSSASRSHVTIHGNPPRCDKYRLLQNFINCSMGKAKMTNYNLTKLIPHFTSAFFKLEWHIEANRRRIGPDAVVTKVTGVFRSMMSSLNLSCV